MRHSTIDSDSGVSNKVSNVDENGYTVLENDSITAYYIDVIGKVNEQQGESEVTRNKCPVVIYSPALVITTEDPSDTVAKDEAAKSYCELFFEQSSTSGALNYSERLEPGEFLKVYSMRTNKSSTSSFRGKLSMLIKGCCKLTTKATAITFSKISEDVNQSVVGRDIIVYQIALGDSCPLISDLNTYAGTSIYLTTPGGAPEIKYVVKHYNLVLRSIDTRMCNVGTPIGEYSTININGTTADIYKVLYATAEPGN